MLQRSVSQTSGTSNFNDIISRSELQTARSLGDADESDEVVVLFRGAVRLFDPAAFRGFQRLGAGCRFAGHGSTCALLNMEVDDHSPNAERLITPPHPLPHPPKPGSNPNPHTHTHKQKHTH